MSLIAVHLQNEEKKQIFSTQPPKNDANSLKTEKRKKKESNKQTNKQTKLVEIQAKFDILKCSQLYAYFQ